MTSEPMLHVCGNCTLCCKLIGVTELRKPPNKWCEYCAIGVGCTIYEDRPHSCKDFECGWLLSNLPLEFRPDNLHIVITGEDNKIGAIILHCDPNYPNAHETANGKRLMQVFANNEKSVIMVTGNKRKIISNSLKDTQRIQAILNQMEKDGGITI